MKNKVLTMATSSLFLLLLAGAAQSAPTTLTLVEGAQTPETVEVGISIEQNDPALMPVLADLRVGYDSATLEFVRAESLVPSKATFAKPLSKDTLRVTLTGFSLAKMPPGPLVRLIFKKIGKAKTSNIGFVEQATKVAPKAAQQVLKLGASLRLQLTRQGE